VSLQVDGLTVRYGRAVLALRDVTLEVPEGDVVAVLGSNGAGKTTLMRALSGLLGHHGAVVESGSIRFRGTLIDTADAAAIVRSGIVHVPEGRRVFAELTVEENLRAGASTVRSRSERAAALERCWEMFPALATRRQQRAALLSGGEQQMLAIGRGLMSSPAVLLLDEPSLGLAPLIVEQIAHTVRRVNEAGTSVVLVEQNASMALSVAHLGFVLELGRVSLCGSASELASGDEVQRLYLGGGAEGDQDVSPRRATDARLLSVWSS
jgi:branched-chain amino acid transport system ATP-binding protein